MIDEKLLQKRGLPAAPQAEKAILGCLLIPGYADISAIADRLPVEDFHLDNHRRIYRAILKLHRQGLKVDLIQLTEELVRTGELEAVGDRPYLYFLTEDIPRGFDPTHHIGILRDRARLRDLLSAASEASDAALDGSGEAPEILDRLNERLQQIRDGGADSEMQQVGKYLASKGEPESILEQMEATDGLKTGFAGFDKMTNGLQRKDLIIVAARPSIGKTGFACNVVYHAAVSQRKSVAFFTLEQPKDAIIRRMLSAATRISATQMREKNLFREDRETILAERQRMAESNLYLDDTPKLTASRIRAKARWLKNHVGLDLIVVDQLSKVSNTDLYHRGMPKHEWVGAQSSAFKLVAQELDVPVVVLNQLGRDTAKRSDPTPQLQDLKESGSIEEDADVVILLHRPEYYDRKDESLKGLGQIIIAKQREGDTGTIECSYNGRILRWEDKIESTPSGDEYDRSW